MNMGFAVLLQSLVLFVVLAVSALFGSGAVKSALAGGLIALLPNGLFAIYLWISARPAAYRFFVGEGIKIVVALVVSVVFWRQVGSRVLPLPYWLAFVLVLKAHNFALLRTVKE